MVCNSNCEFEGGKAYCMPSCTCKEQSKYQVLGLAGKAGSGKDYVYLNHLKPMGFSQVSLAWHFKADLIGKGAITFEEAFVTKPPKIRTLLQHVGTELGRNVYGEKVWCDTLVAWMDIFNFHWGVERFVIPDVRFINEMNFIQQDLGGKVIRIVAPERSGDTTLDDTQRAHPSEAEMDGIIDSSFNGLLYNDPDDPGLQIQLDLLLKEYGWV